MCHPLIGPCGIHWSVHLFADFNASSIRTWHMALPGWCHVASLGGATWHLSIGPHGPLKIPLAGATASSRGATWNFSTGPHGPLKKPLAGDTWKPMVLPCGIQMSAVIMLTSPCHVSCWRQQYGWWYGPCWLDLFDHNFDHKYLPKCNFVWQAIWTVRNIVTRSSRSCHFHWVLGTLNFFPFLCLLKPF